ncbi:MAG: tetratricopeptide repeat protein [Candidatus Omnitrophota bacterium]
MKKQIIIAVYFLFVFFAGVCFAQKMEDPEAKESRDESAVAASFLQKDNQEQNIDSSIDGIFDEYVARHDYDGLYTRLEKLLKERAGQAAEIYYFMALTRQDEIAYWKQTKNWEDIYDKSPAYQKEISGNLVKALNAAKDDVGLTLRIKYLKWRFAREGDSEAAAGFFNDLINTAKEKAEDIQAANIVKAISDELSTLEDKNLSRRLYDVFLEKLAQLNFSAEQLKAMAEEFLSQANAYLAKTVLELYLDQIKDDAALASELVLAADKFATKDSGEALDPLYAEALYHKAFELAGPGVFSASFQYRRAFNLERLKEYDQAFTEYQNLLSNYADYEFKQEIYFRLGVLAAYAKKDIDLACGYFLKLTQEYPQDVQSLSAFYQLGLLNQWQGKKEIAEGFYDNLMSAASSMKLDFEKNEIVSLAQDRIKEIQENKEIKYPLKLFLSGIFVIGQPEVVGFLSVDVTAQPPNENADVPVKLVVTTSTPETGCMVPTYSYEWSGESGRLVNIPNTFDLKTEYANPGIKLVQVAVVGPQGVEGVGFEMVKIVIEDNKV